MQEHSIRAIARFRVVFQLAFIYLRLFSLNVICILSGRCYSVNELENERCKCSRNTTGKMT